MASARVAVPLVMGVAAAAFIADALYGPKAKQNATVTGSIAPLTVVTPTATGAPAASTSQAMPPLSMLSPSDALQTKSLTPGQQAMRDTAIRIGLPSDHNVRFLEGYAASLNFERRIPNWVLEKIVTPPSPPSSGASGGSRTESKFYSDPSVPEMFRASTSDYNDKHGTSRGHLAPAQFHKNSQNEMNETFNLSANIVPQDMTMNACDWYRLESMTKKLAKQYPKGLYVVTGPMFVPTMSPVDPGRRVVSYEVIGEHNVAVPTHLFKAFFGEADDGKKEVAAFVLPNAPIPDESSLVTYQVPLSFVERTTGLQLFAGAAGIDASRAAYQVVDMCRRKKCEGSYGSFSKGNRAVGRIRAASSAAQAQQAFNDAVKAGDGDAAALERELKHKLTELSARKMMTPK
jgi:DNA/RNA endonuclease G (NUC1)